MNHYKLLPLKKVLNWESEAERLGVSKIARGPNGFLEHYKTEKGKLTSDFWIKKRNGFIARHLAQFNKNPTYRRYLALIMWAFEPPITNEKLKQIMNDKK